jgi:hypothetical protein
MRRALNALALNDPHAVSAVLGYAGPEPMLDDSL